MLAGYCAFLTLYAPQPILPLLRQIFHTGEVTVSLTLTVASLGVAIAAPISGVLADRLGRKRIIVWSAYCLAVSSIVTAAAANLPVLIFLRFLQGVFVPGVFSVTVAYVNDEWKEGAGAAMGSYVTGSVLGGFSSRMVSGFVAAHASWQMVFVVGGLMILACAILVRAWLPEESHAHPHRYMEHHWMDGLRAHLRNSKLMGVCAVGFCVLFSLVGIFTYITFRLASPPYALEPGQLGLMFCVYLVGAAVTPVAGRCADRYGYRSTLVAAVALSVAGIAMTLTESVIVIIAGLGVMCAGIFTAQVCGSGFVGTAAKQNRALAVGLYASCYHAGGSVGAAIPGFFYNWAGWPGCAAFIVAIQILTAWIALRFWGETSRGAFRDVRSISA
jgi:MFS family permease